jgi:hypothetical protein
MGAMINAYKILVIKSEQNKVEDVGIYGRIILD